MLYQLPCKKATGIDGISNKILKIAAPAISDSLNYIFNQAITLCNFPDEWKKATVTPVPRSSSAKLPSDL